MNVVQKAYDIPALSAQLDFLNIMAYDLKVKIKKSLFAVFFVLMM